MANTRKKHVSWGSIAGYAFFYVFIALIGLGAAYRWSALDHFFVAMWFAAMAVGSIVVLWRAWKHRKQPGGARLGQIAALPRSWRNWVLGETDDDSPQGPSGHTH